MDIFLEMSLILVVATVVALIMQRLRQPLIMGHIISGIILGPVVFNLIHSHDTLNIFSQFGISILLFIVGLNLSPSVIREVGKTALIVGVGQIVFTSILGAVLGIILGFSLSASVFFGIAFALSSTIIVSKFLSDRKDTGKLYGKIAIGFLLVQDVVATVCLIAISTLQTRFVFSSALLLSLGRASAAIILLFFGSVYLLPRLTKLFAQSQEFLFLFSIGWGLGIAALFQALGFTGEIGALVAGIALAASPYHYEISSKMKLLRDFFLVLFFVLLGAQLSFHGIQNLWMPALLFSAFVLIGNPLIVMILMGLLGYNKKTGFLAGLMVAQISEFSLLIILFAVRAHQLPSESLALVTLVGLITIGVSAYFMRYSDGLYRWLSPILSFFERRSVYKEKVTRERYEAILFGYHRVGTDFLPSLQRWKKKYLVVDFDPEVIQRLTDQHIPCRYGDAEDDEFLNEIQLAHAKMVVSTIPDFETNAYLVDKLRKRNAKAVMITIAHSVGEATALYDAGATYVIMPHFLGGNYASLLVQKYGYSAQKFRKEREKHLSHLRERQP